MLPAGEVFVLSAGARERTRKFSPRAPGDSGRIVWGVFVSGRVCVLFSQEGIVNQGVVAQPWRLVF